MAHHKTPLLDQISTLQDLRAMPERQMQAVADEVRQDMIAAVSQTGGHLGAGLGVVELTRLLYITFDTPKDRLIWDVGHQAYPHKILTGRRERIHTLRQTDGLSGFTKDLNQNLILLVLVTHLRLFRQAMAWLWHVT